ncbi:MAG TPA: amidohydrolase family protein [Vicinamibacterales bacterium]|nr:amidohydrolase family protein [Vicinamibacterales bacterium]
MRMQLPGFFDLQANGFAGVDFNAADLSDERAAAALDAMLPTGVTRVLPTLISSTLAEFSRNARLLARLAHPAVAGIHMEGPYISPADGARGAHPRQCLAAASVDDFARRQDAADGRIVLVTLAPEVPGAIALIEHLAGAGVRAAIGHTAAASQQIADAIAAGATLATHLGNGCAQMLPRHPNSIWDLLADDRVSASFIVDGHHLPPSTVKAMIRSKGSGRSILVTDAIAAAAAPPGRYAIGPTIGESSADGRVSLPGTPYLSGSSLTMDRAIGNAVRFTGLPLQEVASMASTIPAACLGARPSGTVSADWHADRGELRVLEVSR